MSRLSSCTNNPRQANSMTMDMHCDVKFHPTITPTSERQRTVPVETASITTTTRALPPTSILSGLHDVLSIDSKLSSPQPLSINFLTREALRPAGSPVKTLQAIGRNGLVADALPPPLKIPRSFWREGNVSAVNTWLAQRTVHGLDLLEHVVDGRLLAACMPTPKTIPDSKVVPTGDQDPDNFHVVPHIDFNDIFSARHPSVIARVHAVEEQWHKPPLTRVLNQMEVAFWYTCYESTLR